MDENKRKKIEAKLSALFTQTASKTKTHPSRKSGPVVVTVMRKRKGQPNRSFGGQAYE